MIRATDGLAHLIGSVPLATPRRSSAARRRAGPRLSRMPDGETGERRRWICWQRTMLERHPAMEVDRTRAARDPPVGRLPAAAHRAFRAAARHGSRRGRLSDRLRRGRARFVGALRGAPRRAVVPPRAALPGLPAHRHVERLHVREPARARRLPAGLRAFPARRARRHHGRHPPRRAQHPVGHLPGGAGVRDLLPLRPADYKARIFALLERLGPAVPPTSSSAITSATAARPISTW